MRNFESRGIRNTQSYNSLCEIKKKKKGNSEIYPQIDNQPYLNKWRKMRLKFKKKMFETNEDDENSFHVG